MSEALTVYLHFPCFDGVISAVLACEYLERKHGLKTAQIVPVDYSRRATWLSERLAQPAAVVDFLYHPDAEYWADHHQTTFVTPEMEARFRDGNSSSMIYNPQAASCAEAIWSKSYRLLREPRFREMVDWAHRIDGALYESVEEAVLGDAPALRISLSFLKNSSDEYCRLLVESLRSKSLAEVAELPEVADAYRSARKAIQGGQDGFSKKARLEKDGIVVFHAREKTARTLLSRYAPYLAYPHARYSVGILETGNGAKITAMRNPWRRFKSAPLGQIFSRYGGGGHQRVASVLLKDRKEAERTLGSILKDLRHSEVSSPQPAGGWRPNEAAAGD
jgi:hypothetical protein